MTSTESPVALIVTRNLPPLLGGMERLVWHIIDELRADYRVHIIGPTGCSRHLPADTTATEIPFSPLPTFLLRALLESIRRAKSAHPMLVFAGSGLTAPFAWLAAKLTGARYVCYLHGLDIEAHHPIYRVIWLPFIRRSDLTFVNSRFTGDLAVQAGVNPKRIVILHPGVALPDTGQADKLGAEFRERHALGSAPVMLYIGRITERKGLSIFAEHILPHVIQAVPQAQLVVIGDQPNQAVQKGQSELRRTRQLLDSTDMGKHVHFLGSRPYDHPDITAAYFAADVHIFPVQDSPGDNEGFGMVALEAAAHGLPTVAYAVGGVSDAIKNGVSGALIAPDDSDTFCKTVIEQLMTKHNCTTLSCRKFAESFTWSRFGETLRQHLGFET